MAWSFISSSQWLLGASPGIYHFPGNGAFGGHLISRFGVTVLQIHALLYLLFGSTGTNKSNKITRYVMGSIQMCLKPSSLSSVVFSPSPTSLSLPLPLFNKWET